MFLVCIGFISCNNTGAETKVVSFQKDLFLMKNGVLNYNNIPFTGTLFFHDEVNKTNNFTTYEKGLKHGVEFKKYKNNVLAEQRFYTKGKKSGVHKSWWSENQLRFEYHFNDVGEYNGKVNEWFKNGQQLKAFNYIKGKEDGAQKMWNIDGKIRANFVTVNGERYGLIGLKKCYTINTINEDFK
jgi:antitoxin component YwqK of YwqJK toxin-antitoxin module